MRRPLMSPRGRTEKRIAATAVVSRLNFFLFVAISLLLFQSLHHVPGVDASLESSRLSTSKFSKISQSRLRRRPLALRGGSSVSSSAPSAAASLSPKQQQPKTTTIPHQQHSQDATEATISSSVASSLTSSQTAPGDQSSSTQPLAMTDEAHDRQVLRLIRVLFLAYYGSLGSLMPYLPVYYHSLGHGGLIIGMLGAVKPLTTFLVAPFWGILSDKSDNRFNILYFTFVVSCAGQLMVALRNDVWFLMGMVFITAVFNAPVKSLIDSLVMDRLNDRRDYGRLRLWGQLGFGLGSSGVGMLLSRSKRNQMLREQAGAIGTADQAVPLDGGDSVVLPMVNQLYKFWQNLTGYRLLFFAYAALSIPAWLCLKAFERMDEETERRQHVKAMARGEDRTIKPKKEQAYIGEGLRLLFQNGEAILFFFLVFVVGVSSGIIENFAYVRMREVGGSGKEMGLSRLVSSAAGAPMFWFSGPLTERLGADRVLTLSLLSYVTRFFIYALMRNPYHGLPAEALRGVTFAAFWSTGTIYAHRISPPGMGATMLMFLNAMYGGLGQSLGAIIGGKLQSKFGTVKTFVYSGIFDFCFVGFVVIYLKFRKNSSFRDPKPIRPREDTIASVASSVMEGRSGSAVTPVARTEQTKEGSPTPGSATVSQLPSASSPASLRSDDQGNDRRNAPRL